MKHPLIIGAGGVASYLLPCLIKAFKPERITLIDKDILEERNLDRQMFSREFIGTPKAEAMGLIIADGRCDIRVVNEWFSPTTKLPDDIDTIICVADNHEARRNAIARAYDLGIRCYVGGNEYFDAEAYVTFEEHKDTKLDPRVRYPAIATSNEGSPMRCQGEEQEIHPQLAIANYRCAGHIMHLMYAWQHYDELPFKDKAEIKDLVPIEICSSLYDQTIQSTNSFNK